MAVSLQLPAIVFLVFIYNTRELKFVVPKDKTVEQKYINANIEKHTIFYRSKWNGQQSLVLTVAALDVLVWQLFCCFSVFVWFLFCLFVFILLVFYLL